MEEKCNIINKDNNEISNPKKRGLFIVFEGADRTGKTTQIELLKDKYNTNLNENNDEIVSFMRFPDRNTIIGNIINNYLSLAKENNNISDECAHLLFSANRWEKQNEIIKTLEKGVHIICDRYYMSGCVYSISKGLNEKWCCTPDIGIVEPDLTIILESSIDSITKRPNFGAERFENTEFQNKIIQNYQNFRKKDCHIIVDASKSIGEVNKNIERIINKYLSADYYFPLRYLEDI